MNWRFVVTRAAILVLSVIVSNFVATIGPLSIHAQEPEPRLADGRIDYLTKLNQLLRVGVTPDNNAAVILLEVLGERVIADVDQTAFLREIGLTHLPDNRPKFVSADEYVRQLGYSARSVERETWVKATEQALKGPWNAEQLPEVARWIEINELAIAEVLKASHLPRYYCPLLPSRETAAMSNIPVYEVSLELGQTTRELTRFLGIRARKKLGSGNTAAAISDIQALRRLATLQTQSLTIVESLLAVAIHQQAFLSEIELLGSGKLTVEQCNAYRAFLRDYSIDYHFAERIETAERWMFLDAVQVAPSGKILDFEIPYDASDLDIQVIESHAKNYTRLAEVWRSSHDLERMKKIQAVEVELTDDVQRQPTGEVLAEAASNRILRSRIVGDTLFALVMPNCGAMVQSDLRTKVTHDLSELGFALESYRLDHGRFPKTLDELQPKYLAEIPTDRFTARPLIYRPDAKGYLLYSVGQNQKDDQGETLNKLNDADDWRIKIQLDDHQLK